MYFNSEVTPFLPHVPSSAKTHWFNADKLCVIFSAKIIHDHELLFLISSGISGIVDVRGQGAYRLASRSIPLHLAMFLPGAWNQHFSSTARLWVYVICFYFGSLLNIQLFSLLEIQKIKERKTMLSFSSLISVI